MRHEYIPLYHLINEILQNSLFIEHKWNYTFGLLLHPLIYCRCMEGYIKIVFVPSSNVSRLKGKEDELLAEFGTNTVVFSLFFV